MRKLTFLAGLAAVLLWCVSSTAFAAKSRCNAPPYGGTQTEYKAFSNSFGQAVDPHTFLPGICKMKFERGDRTSLYKLGFADADIDSQSTEDLAVAVIVAIKKSLQESPPGQPQSSDNGNQNNKDAQENSDVSREMQMTKCRLVGDLYQHAATIRDSGRSPEVALNMLQGMPMVSLAEKKAAINQVYFDPAFEGAGGEALSSQMTSICITQARPRNTYQPLK